MQHRTFSAGETIFREGDQSEEAYWIIAGKVEISIETPAGPSVLTTLGDGEIFGEMGMIDDKPRAATARALTDVEVEVIDEAGFQEHIVRREDRVMPYLDTLFDRLRTTNALLSAHLGKSWRESRYDSAPVNPSGEVLKPVTLRSTAASASMYPDGLEMKVARFPFRIGRRTEDGRLFSRMDLPLRDKQPYMASRSHCRIECKGGEYFVRDCGSALGTIVNGVKIGAEHGRLAATLSPGENTMTIGSEESPHQYLVVVG